MLNRKARHKARALALQALYQNQFNALDTAVLKAQFMTNNAHIKVDWDFFQVLVDGVFQHQAVFDEAISIQMEREFTETNPVELAALRLGAFELMYRIDVPYKVVIDEYVDLVKEYGAESGHTFVNSVLDQLAKQFRTIEVNQ